MPVAQERSHGYLCDLPSDACNDFESAALSSKDRPTISLGLMHARDLRGRRQCCTSVLKLQEAKYSYSLGLTVSYFPPPLPTRILPMLTSG